MRRKKGSTFPRRVAFRQTSLLRTLAEKRDASLLGGGDWNQTQLGRTSVPRSAGKDSHSAASMLQIPVSSGRPERQGG
jgi:hypothetical protein